MSERPQTWWLKWRRLVSQKRTLIRYQRSPNTICFQLTPNGFAIGCRCLGTLAARSCKKILATRISLVAFLWTSLVHWFGVGYRLVALTWCRSLLCALQMTTGEFSMMHALTWFWNAWLIPSIRFITSTWLKRSPACIQIFSRPCLLKVMRMKKATRWTNDLVVSCFRTLLWWAAENALMALCNGFPESMGFLQFWTDGVITHEWCWECMLGVPNAHWRREKFRHAFADWMCDCRFVVRSKTLIWCAAYWHLLCMRDIFCNMCWLAKLVFTMIVILLRSSSHARPIFVDWVHLSSTAFEFECIWVHSYFCWLSAFEFGVMENCVCIFVWLGLFCMLPSLRASRHAIRLVFVYN